MSFVALLAADLLTCGRFSAETPEERPSSRDSRMRSERRVDGHSFFNSDIVNNTSD